MSTSKVKDDVFYVCTLIEYLERKTKNHRSDIVRYIGKEGLQHQLEFADVNHCLTHEEVSDELIEEYNIPIGTFDSVAECEYDVPAVSPIARNYQRLILDITEDPNQIIDVIYDVFSSFISDAMSDFNSSFYYSCPEYFYHCYIDGEILP